MGWTAELIGRRIETAMGEPGWSAEGHGAADRGDMPGRPPRPWAKLSANVAIEGGRSFVANIARRNYGDLMRARPRLNKVAPDFTRRRTALAVGSFLISDPPFSTKDETLGTTPPLMAPAKPRMPAKSVR